MQGQAVGSGEPHKKKKKEGKETGPRHSHGRHPDRGGAEGGRREEKIRGRLQFGLKEEGGGGGKTGRSATLDLYHPVSVHHQEGGAGMILPFYVARGKRGPRTRCPTSFTAQARGEKESDEGNTDDEILRPHCEGAEKRKRCSGLCAAHY